VIYTRLRCRHASSSLRRSMYAAVDQVCMRDETCNQEVADLFQQVASHGEHKISFERL